MPTFSQQSLDKLATADQRLQDICNEVIKDYDFTVLCGFRSQEDQDEAVAAKKSHTPWPTSKHNTTPSQAVDLASYPIDWSDIDRFRELAARMQVAADKLGIKIRWGGTFATIRDYDHFELV